ncbi:HAMP domain-containing protein [Prosthecobacter fusiformis]|uniref:histidine kinase n=1 Tax=Prosthecobacter fusiformis TaxID=48464 RepID=A0A4R7RIL6_9BACT|nr:ATP-binding protein [Prosthecobacter fusiformis]TDU63187.1 HAMP domain-containing protein [Prosthecobacter fusiformis]
MQFLHDIPIKRKLTIIIMSVSSAALLLACAVILMYERHAFRETMARDLAIMADTLDDNVASGLSFNDPESIEHTLSTLQANPIIMAACVYDVGGERVAEYQRPDLDKPFDFAGLEATGQTFHKDYLDTFKTIILANEVIGSVYIAADLEFISQRLKRSATFVLAVLLASLLLAFFLSTRLQKFISVPVHHLAEIAGRVAKEKDYSVRAVKQSDDELGSLIDAFNEMLSQIQMQDSELHTAQSNLETRVQERTQELAKSLSLLNATLDSTADGIIAIQFTGEVVCHNRHFAEMWSIPPELLEKPDKNKLLEFIAAKTVNPEVFIFKGKELELPLEKEVFDRIYLKSGQTFERYAKPQLVNGKEVGVVINFRDITSREQAVTSLAEANTRLLSTSRQAGMAEVATSILHNVGNVLNSVSVSAEVVSTKVRQFRIGSLKNLAGLLQENAANLGTFLSTDPRGKEVPAYMMKLVGQLAEPQQGILEELESLRKNIEHIKEIVAMQQNYARGCGVMEEISVSELIDDAIRINAAGFTRHELSLVCDIQDDQPILTDRHKVLQILVNLLGNAKYAVAQTQEEKILTVRVTRDENKAVQISIIDNGVGIASENLTRIFQHGFTTKKDGHGFGLHSGALAARELGGNLTAYSAGIGRGATFTLELPCPKQPPFPTTQP